MTYVSGWGNSGRFVGLSGGNGGAAAAGVAALPGRHGAGSGPAKGLTVPPQAGRTVGAGLDQGGTVKGRHKRPAAGL